MARCCLLLANKVDDSRFSEKHKPGSVISVSKKASDCLKTERNVYWSIVQILPAIASDHKPKEGRDDVTHEEKEAILHKERDLLKTLGMFVRHD